MVNMNEESLRDHFATTALKGLMLRYNEDGYSDRDAVSEAYRIADMMLERRTQELGKDSLLPGKENGINDIISKITIKYENDTQISIQRKGQRAQKVDLTQLGFRECGGKVMWNNFLKVLQDPPHYSWYCPRDADRKQLSVVSERLAKWMSKEYGVNIPKKLYSLRKNLGQGHYQFKFNIEFK